MFNSIAEDIKRQFRVGNMVTKIILLNVIIWAIMALVKSFTPGNSDFYETIVQYLSIPGEPLKLLFKPWTVFTHMFIHGGFWHMFWNMIMLYWFGRIVGDLVGDKHILPIYFLGGFAGALAFVVAYMILPTVVGSYALGASAAVMTLVMAAGRIAPEYEMRLILIGPVKLKYIVFALIVFDLIGAGGTNNTGGHIAHLAGIAMGWLFVSQLGSENDWSMKMNRYIDWLGNLFNGKDTKQTKSPLTVKYKSSALDRNNSNLASQEQVDKILDKIKKSGFNSLTTNERDILAKASKEN